MRTCHSMGRMALALSALASSAYAQGQFEFKCDLGNAIGCTRGRTCRIFMFRNAEQHDRANTELSKFVDLTSQRVDGVLHNTWKRRDRYRVGHTLTNKERSNEILNVYSGFGNKVSHRRRRTKSPRTVGRKRCGIKNHDSHGTSTGRRRHTCESLYGQLKYFSVALMKPSIVDGSAIAATCNASCSNSARIF